MAKSEPVGGGAPEEAPRSDDHEKAMMEVLTERDEAQEWADNLAYAVGEYFDIDVGEHSSCSDPRVEAMKILKGEYVTKFDKPAQEEAPSPAELSRFRCDCGRWLLVEGSVIGKESGVVAEEEATSPDTLKEIADWFRSEAEKCLTQARSRRPDPATRNASLAELKAGKVMAEKIAGRKLPLATVTREANIAYCDMQDRIADKLETEGRKLLAWSELLSGKSGVVAEEEATSSLRHRGEAQTGAGLGYGADKSVRTLDNTGNQTATHPLDQIQSGAEEEAGAPTNDVFPNDGDCKLAREIHKAFCDGIDESCTDETEWIAQKLAEYRVAAGAPEPQEPK